MNKSVSVERTLILLKLVLMENDLGNLLSFNPVELRWKNDQFPKNEVEKVTKTVLCSQPLLLVTYK